MASFEWVLKSVMMEIRSTPMPAPIDALVHDAAMASFKWVLKSVTMGTTTIPMSVSVTVRWLNVMVTQRVVSISGYAHTVCVQGRWLVVECPFDPSVRTTRELEIEAVPAMRTCINSNVVRAFRALSRRQQSSLSRVRMASLPSQLLHGRTACEVNGGRASCL